MATSNPNNRDDANGPTSHRPFSEDPSQPRTGTNSHPIDKETSMYISENETELRDLAEAGYAVSPVFELLLERYEKGLD